MSEFVKSFSNNINSLTNGLGYPKGVLIAIFGSYMCGKSTLLLYEAYNFMEKEKKNVLWLDTEGGINLYIKVNEPIFNKKFKVNKNRIIVKEIKGEGVNGIKEIMNLMGMNVNFERDESGRVVINYQGDFMIQNPKDKRKKIPYSEMMELIKKENIGMIVLDSITKPMKEAFVGLLKSYPSRDEAYSLLLGKLLVFTTENNLLTFITSHESFDPMKQYASPTIVGGKAIKHLCKVWYHLEKPSFTKKELLGFRRMQIVRFPNIPEWSKEVVLEFTQDGIIDSSEAEIEKRREEVKKKEK